MRTIVRLWRAFMAPRPLTGPIMVATFKDTRRRDRPAFLDAARRHPGVEVA